ncbi:G-type lectin S-receptor-like serine threonine-kinase At4g27290 [Olea europaea subsp. europaea]|uniref:non-specific serine/threonine protein kinase n=1 Tax=Olea europaea subsp. europaea TaxID=158383 RepID=A0A8S0PMY3_OLEEU|nr:G-type lectin S-receptor-like serine threonine-kinase At4g27290 [Olea europaea subsp. europaea]
MKKSSKDISFLLVFSSLLYILEFSTAIDIINTTQIIRDGDTLVSYGGIFELGFFSPGNSKNRYLGTWYKKMPGRTVVWVANKETPIRSTSGILKIIEPGFLVIMDDSNNTIWSSNTSRVAQTPILQLLDSGNLVLREANDYNPDNFLWQSFDYLSYTFLPGVNFGWNYATDKNKTYYREDPIVKSVITRATLSQSGVAERWTWVEKIQDWVLYLSLPADNCDSYRLCGPYASCHIANSPACGCLDRFEPKDPKGWVREDWSSGCIRRTPLNCQKDDVFLKYSGVKLPDTQYLWFNENMTLEECKVTCLKNYSCMAYTQLNISREESGCLFWVGDLIDIRDLSSDGQDIYIRMDSSESGSHRRDLELPLFSLSTMSKATDNFSIYKKLGQDQTKSMLLDWSKHLQVLNGVARGLMYIHQDSLLRIVHRDLKASNILLDTDMNPMISDLGIARSFRGNETEDKTSRVVGTYGYMSPEYAVHGRFSMKFDAFSFGVIVLETVSGKRNSGFSSIDQHRNLLGHAWTLYKEGRSFELVDTYLHDSAYLSEVQRLIHIGLLCVQQCPDDRPSMNTVVVMLNNEGMFTASKSTWFF